MGRKLRAALTGGLTPRALSRVGVGMTLTPLSPREAAAFRPGEGIGYAKRAFRVSRRDACGLRPVASPGHAGCRSAFAIDLRSCHARRLEDGERRR